MNEATLTTEEAAQAADAVTATAEGTATEISGAVAATTLLGAALTPYAPAPEFLRWLLDDQPPPPQPEGIFTYAVLQCTTSLVWGMCRDDVWQWAWRFDPAIEKPNAQRLLEARVFGQAQEILMWRVGDFYKPEFQGRRLADKTDAQQSKADKIPGHAPLTEYARYEGEVRRQHSPDFQRRETEGGRVIVVPTGQGIVMRQYLEADAVTGALRIAATRFVEVY